MSYQIGNSIFHSITFAREVFFENEGKTTSGLHKEIFLCDNFRKASFETPIDQRLRIIDSRDLTTRAFLFYLFIVLRTIRLVAKSQYFI